MSDVRIERVEPCAHGLVNNHDYGPPHDPIECIGGFRTVLSGFPPEAVEAAAKASYEDYTQSMATEAGMGAKGKAWEDAPVAVKVNWRHAAQIDLDAAWRALTGEADTPLMGADLPRRKPGNVALEDVGEADE